MTCEYPNCSQSIESICTNHCHWSLCHEHLFEHKTSLLLEFQLALDDLIKPTNQLAKSLEQTKKLATEKHENELERIRQVHNQQLEQLEQQINELNKYQNRLNQISEDLIAMKNKQKQLKHDDFHQLDLLNQDLQRLENAFKPSTFSDQCPLTSLNIFGLSSSHHVRLCSPNKQHQNLFEHFRNYHHLMPIYANKLLEAIQFQHDPMQTIIFPLNTQVIVLDDKYPCVFYEHSLVNGISSKSCSTMVTKKFFPIHLKTVHRLRLPQIQQVLQSFSTEIL